MHFVLGALPQLFPRDVDNAAGIHDGVGSIKYPTLGEASSVVFGCSSGLFFASACETARGIDRVTLGLARGKIHGWLLACTEGGCSVQLLPRFAQPGSGCCKIAESVVGAVG